MIDKPRLSLTDTDNVWAHDVPCRNTVAAMRGPVYTATVSVSRPPASESVFFQVVVESDTLQVCVPVDIWRAMAEVGKVQP